jgi:hypothetical protein
MENEIPRDKPNEPEWWWFENIRKKLTICHIQKTQQAGYEGILLIRPFDLRVRLTFAEFTEKYGIGTWTKAILPKRR